MRWHLIHESSARRPTPGRRFDGTAWHCNAALWLFGGRRAVEDDLQLSDTWRFDLLTQTWTSMSRDVSEANARRHAPSGRLDPAFWAERSDLLMYGGSIGNNPSSELWRFDTQRFAWTEDERGAQAGEPTPGIRSGSVSWYDCEKRAWLFGGIGGSPLGFSDILGDLWSYSTASGSWRLEAAGSSGCKILPQPRTHASHCLSGKCCWVFGGYDRSPHGIPLLDLWSFEKRTGEAKRWWDAADLNSGPGPSARSGAVLFADLLENVYVFGGQQTYPRKHLNDLWKFEPLSRKWIQLPRNDPDEKANESEAWPSPRSQCSTWIDGGGHLWLFGGYGDNAAGNTDICGDFWLLQV
jgi:N-acetylneuraminic acid mutarotase